MNNGFMIVYWVSCGVITGLNTVWIIWNTLEIKRLKEERKRLEIQLKLK